MCTTRFSNFFPIVRTASEEDAGHASVFVEKNSFLFEQQPLSEGRFSGKFGERPVFFYHSVPGDVFGAGVERPADLTCHMPVSGKKGDLSVAGDRSGRDRTDNVVYAVKEIHAEISDTGPDMRLYAD